MNRLSCYEIDVVKVPKMQKIFNIKLNLYWSKLAIFSDLQSQPEIRKTREIVDHNGIYMVLTTDVAGVAAVSILDKQQ